MVLFTPWLDISLLFASCCSPINYVVVIVALIFFPICPYKFLSIVIVVVIIVVVVVVVVVVIVVVG